MSEKLEEMIRDYSKKKEYLEYLQRQLDISQLINDEDMIESLYYSHPEGERVQTSGINDKTARIAATYREKMDRINNEWHAHWAESLKREYLELSDDLQFFESALRMLPQDLSEIMIAMAIRNETWECICLEHDFSKPTLGKYRKRAIQELERIYAEREKAMIDYMLS